MSRIDGPLYTLFDDAVTAAVLDQAVIVGKMPQTVRMLSESTGFSTSLIKYSIRKLLRFNLVRRVKKNGRTVAYSFKVETTLRDLVSWATVFNLSRRPSK